MGAGGLSPRSPPHFKHWSKQQLLFAGRVICRSLATENQDFGTGQSQTKNYLEFGIFLSLLLALRRGVDIVHFVVRYLNPITS